MPHSTFPHNRDTAYITGETITKNQTKITEISSCVILSILIVLLVFTIAIAVKLLFYDNK